MSTTRSAPPTAGSSADCTIVAPLRRAARTHRSTIGALSASGTSPSTTTTCASAIAESGRRYASSAVRDLLRQHGLVRAETLAHELRERVRLLDRLRAGERDDDAAVRRLQQPFGDVERVVPRDGLEAAAPHALDRVDDAVGRAQVREREAALVAQPALVDLVDGCARGSA